MKATGRNFAIGAVVLLVVVSGAVRADTFQGFETDIAGWNVFGAPFDAVRVPSGTAGITSASGNWHALVGVGSAGNWGGYNCLAGCAGTGCAALGNPFPPLGYATSVDIYLDVNAGFPNNSRFDFDSAINEALPSGSFRRDFIFNAGFYNDNDGSPGSGTNRFIVSAGNNSQPGSAYAKNPAHNPIAIQQSGWYTFKHEFYDAGGGVLAVDMSIYDSSGTLVNTWTLSDGTDIIGVTIGGNRYGWFDYNEIATLSFDNAEIIGCTPSGCCTDGPGTDSTCVIDRRDFCEDAGGLYLGDGTTCTPEPDCTTLLVTFESISATATRQGTLIEWTTLTEVDTVGFRILRETPGRAEKFLEVLVPMMPAAGTSLTGASYQYLDAEKHPASSVYYVEDVDIYGKVTRHGPIAIQHAVRDHKNPQESSGRRSTK
jgi:hypothetical protein